MGHLQALGKHNDEQRKRIDWLITHLSLLDGGVNDIGCSDCEEDVHVIYTKVVLPKRRKVADQLAEAAVPAPVPPPAAVAQQPEAPAADLEKK